ncbi:phiSA1p31-related protein [Streptomyces sp. NPDC026672]|uniref:phiSA1p31-related protein n=1 Tax=Actinomycetes TaxID=1760 RepID=UPI0033D65C76
MAFKTGDKVKHRSWGAGEIAYGPYLRDGSMDNYLMKREDGEHRFVDSEDMTLNGKFSVGDKVRGHGTEYTVKGGPFFGPVYEWYAIEDARGTDYSINAGSLTLAESTPDADEALKPGDVIRIPTAGLAGADVEEGDLLVVKEIDAYGNPVAHAAPGARMDEWWFQSGTVERFAGNTYVHDGIVYDLSAKYRDNEGDVWKFSGRLRGGVPNIYMHNPNNLWDTIASIADAYGPLTRVND